MKLSLVIILSGWISVKIVDLILVVKFFNGISHWFCKAVFVTRFLSSSSSSTSTSVAVFMCSCASATRCRARAWMPRTRWTGVTRCVSGAKECRSYRRLMNWQSPSVYTRSQPIIWWSSAAHRRTSVAASSSSRSVWLCDLQTDSRLSSLLADSTS